MPQPIDPYHLFLGIPPHLQPPNHYRLLGLELFENNPAVIEAAADRQMAHVRRYEQSAYAAHTQKVLNELSKAKIGLLLPERKSAYDAALRKQLASATASASSLRQGVGIPKSPQPEEEEELILVPDPPITASPKSNNGNVRDRTSPSASKIGKSTRPLPPAAPRTIAAPRAAEAYSPITPAAYEPPYMGEYRRRFFETLLKVIIFVFILALLLLVFNAFVLPRWKDSQTARETSPENKTATSSTAGETTPSAPGLPNSSKEDSVKKAESSQMRETPAEKRGETEPERSRAAYCKIIKTAMQNNAIRRTAWIGEETGAAFESKFDNGGLLVGLKLTWKKLGTDGDKRAVASLQPEYLTSRGYVKGSVYGAPQKNNLRILAARGYAIGALKINYSAGGRYRDGTITGLRIIFMRIDGLRLDPQDTYMSSSFPLDDSVPRTAPEIGGNGDLIVGIFGRSSEEDLHSVGLLHLKQDAFPTSLADSGQMPPSPDGMNFPAETHLLPEGREHFIGFWHIYEEEKYVTTISLQGNDKARDSRYHNLGGTWEYKNAQVRILWKDGWKDILQHDGDKVVRYSFAPSDPNEKTPVNEGTAVKK